MALVPAGEMTQGQCEMILEQLDQVRFMVHVLLEFCQPQGGF